MIEFKEKNVSIFNRLARHPLQSWPWGEFRKKTGVGLTRLIDKEKNRGKEVFQITWHKLPFGGCIGYCPKSSLPSKEEMLLIAIEAKKRGAIFVKFEPGVKVSSEAIRKINSIKKDFNFVMGRPLFTKYTFQLDIGKSEDELLAKMHQKTRYNLRLAQKKGVRVVEDNSKEGFDDYWRLMKETTIRQGFFAHGEDYHRKMWQTMTESGVGHLFKAVYQEKVLTTWMIFILNGVIYYPYGASSNENREVMASNLMMWEVIRFGKKHGCKIFDMWGSLGPEPDTRDPWFGFHKFKQGYGAELVEFVGSYDLIIDNLGYSLYLFVDKMRWLVLKTLTKIRR